MHFFLSTFILRQPVAQHIFHLLSLFFLSLSISLSFYFIFAIEPTGRYLVWYTRVQSRRHRIIPAFSFFLFILSRRYCGQIYYLLEHYDFLIILNILGIAVIGCLYFTQKKKTNYVTLTIYPIYTLHAWIVFQLLFLHVISMFLWLSP